MKKIIIVFLILLVLALGVFFYLRYQVYSSVGENQNQEIEIVKGQGAKDIGELLEARGIIKNNLYFNYYVLRNDIADKILPGNYFFASGMTIPEIAQLIIQDNPQDVKITFPEGWTIKQMAERLSEKGLPGDEFLSEAQNGSGLEDKFEFLKNRKAESLEGYLFPDTYFFLPDASAQSIIEKMLNNFDSKVDSGLRIEITNQGKTLDEIITMASIVEREVDSEEDRRIVSGIFWNRIEIGQALQSCATVAYAKGENKKQFTAEDIEIESPYNTYQNPGFPPGPIGNPGLSAIEAAINPQNSQYFYFLSDPETGATIFSRTFEEHNANKAKYGL